MTVEINLLKALATRTNYDRFSASVNPDGLTAETKWLLDKYKLMYESGYDSIQADELFAFTYNKLGVSVSAEKNTVFKTIMEQAGKADEADVKDTINRFIQLDYAHKIADVTNRMIDGEQVSLDDVLDELDKYKTEVNFEEKGGIVAVDMDWAALKKNIDPREGLKWGLGCLNEVAGSVKRGDLIVVFARPDSGKTSFVVSQTAHMINQVPEGKQIIWFNNEELGDKIAARYYTCIRNQPAQDLPDNLPKLTNVFIYDNPRISKRDVEAILKDHDPALIVFNSMDKIKGFDAANSDTHRLRDTYQWGRELAKQYAPVIAVCQCSADGEGRKVIGMDMLADSKTDKAGEADLIIGLGRTSEDDTIRYVSTPKNKLTGTSKTARAVYGRAVKFDPNTGRFWDVNEMGLPQ